MAMLVTLVGMSLSALLVPIVVGQVIATRTSAERIQELDAAQAGIDVALGRLRAASDGAGNGVLEALPACDLTGSLSPDTSLRPARYRVTITYRNADGAAMNCPPPDVPTTASLTATGIMTPEVTFSAGSPGTRTIDATYTFSTTNANISGGAIRLASSANGALCMDSGLDASPAAGTRLQMQPCVSGTSDQRFAYTPDLNLQLVGSQSSTVPKGMCLDAGSPHANGAYVAFQPCLDRIARQQWSLNDSSNFQGTGDGVTLDSYCFNLQNPGTSGSLVELGGCGSGDNQRIFRPQPGVGAGMAGTTTGQLVNFKQFSRCLDVTNHRTDWTYMIIWFCKQAPDGNVSWNQKWTLPTVTTPATNATGRIRTPGPDTAGYCLKSPGSTASNTYVTVQGCPATGTLATNLQWTLYGDTGDYTTSYRITDGYGNCLTPTDLDTTNPDTHTDGTAKTKVATCNNTELQKWNAPPNFNTPLALTNTTER